MFPKLLAMLSLCGALLAQTALADVFDMGPGLTSVQFVTVGNPGNAPDIRYKYISIGSVDHVYQIGKYEITAGQYTEFLNAVAKDDPHGLYNPALAYPASPYLGANIQRSGSTPNFSYSVAADWANRPVNYISFWDAARFANWLQNGQPTGAQGPGTTESGAYINVDNQSTFTRQPGAQFFIPNEDEWYKAAYHNKSAGLAASYFDYPTGSNTVPANTLPDPGNHANFYDAFGPGNGGYTIGSPYYRTEVGAFVNSASPYGTFDQVGNVWEWNETTVGESRGYRGGAFQLPSNYMDPSLLGCSTCRPTDQYFDVGFRVASLVAEPSTGVLAILACGAMCWWRKRFNA
jgi:sulfatase modifying factor 1